MNYDKSLQIEIKNNNKKLTKISKEQQNISIFLRRQSKSALTC